MPKSEIFFYFRCISRVAPISIPFERSFTSTCATRMVPVLSGRSDIRGNRIGCIRRLSCRWKTRRTATDSCRLRNTFCPLGLPSSSTYRALQATSPTCELGEVWVPVITRERLMPSIVRHVARLYPHHGPRIIYRSKFALLSLFDFLLAKVSTEELNFLN